ncbi:MAG: M15 family metallopeptidase [Myxococcales bacterium]
MNQAFTFVSAEIPEHVRLEMSGRSWHPDPQCPAFDELRLLTLSHHGFDGAIHQGELVVHRDVSQEVEQIFARLFELGFAIERMQRIDAYGGNDDASMTANNSSAFNFRRIQGSALLSHHALGKAIDLNPIQNPWVRGERVDPEAGRAYLARDLARAGMIVDPGPVIETFAAHGWYWGGHFRDMQDYHHFSKLPR